MGSWKDLLEKKGILIADGGWGSELVKRGLEAGVAPETWNLAHREEVLAVASAYVEAGADLILTNTFGGSGLKLAKAKVEATPEELNRVGVEISREAAGRRAFVFGSMGPTGEFMEPLGTVTEAKMVEDFGVQAGALAAGGADGIVIETMTDLAEAKAALRAVRETVALPVAVSMTFDRRRNGYATMMGVRPDQAAVELERAGADIVGANCGAGIEEMCEVVRLMRAATGLPVWCKPNAGLPELVDGRTVYAETPDRMVSRFGALVEAGARIIGGCCGTTPGHIRAFVRERDRLSRSATRR